MKWKCSHMTSLCVIGSSKMAKSRVFGYFLLLVTIHLSGCDGGGGGDSGAASRGSVDVGGSVLNLGVWRASQVEDGFQVATALPLKVAEAVDDYVELQFCGGSWLTMDFVETYYGFGESGVREYQLNVEDREQFNFVEDDQSYLVSRVSSASWIAGGDFDQGVVTVQGILSSEVRFNDGVCAYRIDLVEPGVGLFNNPDLRVSVHAENDIFSIRLPDSGSLEADVEYDFEDNYTVFVNSASGFLATGRGEVSASKGAFVVHYNSSSRFSATFNVLEWDGQRVPSVIFVDVTFL